MSISTTNILMWLFHYRYLALFFLTVIEGPIVTIISGALAAANIFNFFIIYILIVLGDLTGDSLYYSIGRWGGQKILKKWGHYFHIDTEKIDLLREHFHNHGLKTLIFGKTQAIGSVILVAAGAAEMPYFKFILYNLFATLVKTFLLLMFGYYFIQAFFSFHKYAGAAIFIFTVLSVTIVLLYNYFKKQNLKN
jgi:membrane protein DedA with SNARE-associated domain